MSITKSQNQGAEYKIRVKGGDLAAKGSGTMTIVPTTDGRFSVNVLFPSETGTLKPLDLTSVERVHLVARKVGWFGKNQWVKPLVITVGNFIGVPFILGELVGRIPTAGGVVGVFVFMVTTYGAGVYTGARLTRLARFVLTTEDGKYAVLEGSENAFCFLDGVYTAPNIQLEEVAPETPAEEPAADEAPEVPAADPAPTMA